MLVCKYIKEFAMPFISMKPVHLPTPLGKPLQFFNLRTGVFAMISARRVAATGHCYWRSPEGALQTSSQMSVAGWRRVRVPVSADTAPDAVHPSNLETPQLLTVIG
jgi:hypothetical protein